MIFKPNKQIYTRIITWFIQVITEVGTPVKAKKPSKGA
jgi:hypothetical protein